MNKIRHFLKNLGPGLVTGAADNDPAGISTYSVAGAKTGYGLLWLSILTLPMTIAVQGMSAKVGLVTKSGLAAVIRNHYSRWVLYVAALLLVVSNVTIIAADLLGMSAGFNLLIPQIPIAIFVIPVAALMLFIIIKESYKSIERFLKWLALIFFTYVFAAFLAHPAWGTAIKSTVIPTIHLNGTFVAIALAVLGTTITPYLFFWQSAEEVEELRSRHGHFSIKDMLIDVNSGMVFLHLIFFFVILTTATTLFGSGHEIVTAADAAQALKPIAGPLSEQLFAIGLIGAGFLAVPVLAGSTAYTLAETFGWKEGFESRFKKAHGFYGTLSLSMILGVALALSGLDVLTALVYSQVLAGVIAPILLVLLLLICNNRRIMGEATNGWFFNLFGALTVLVMAGTSILLIFYH